MQWNWPVMVSNLEAQAFCRWKGSRLGKKIRLLSHEEHRLIVEKTELPAGKADLRLHHSSKKEYTIKSVASR